MIGSKVKLSQLKASASIRLDPKFSNFINFNIEKYCDSKDYCELGNVLTHINSPIINKGILDDAFLLIDLANIEHKADLLVDLEEVTEIGSNKNLIRNGDLVIPKLEPKKGQFFLNLSHNEYLGSTELIEYEINKDLYNPIFLYSLLTSESFLKTFSFLESGKTHKRVNPETLLKVKVPLIPVSIQNEKSILISSLRDQILSLKTSKLKINSIINDFFGEFLDFNWDEFEFIKKEALYSSRMSDFSNNIDCRMGVRFHNKAGDYLQSFLENITDKRVKDFISEPIVLGKSVSPKDYSEDGEYYYIAMSNIKNWAFVPDNCKRVSNEYSSGNLNKTVRQGDILLARSGEGSIGKVALIENDDIDGIFADFTQRIRLEHFDPLCAYYYFRSEFFQYLIYTHKKGLGNNTNIFPSQVREFPMPDWNESQQAEIVESIRTQLDKQNEIDRQIKEKHEMIDKIIENAISSEK